MTGPCILHTGGPQWTWETIIALTLKACMKRSVHTIPLVSTGLLDTTECKLSNWYLEEIFVVLFPPLCAFRVKPFYLGFWERFLYLYVLFLFHKRSFLSVNDSSAVGSKTRQALTNEKSFLCWIALGYDCNTHFCQCNEIVILEKWACSVMN